MISGGLEARAAAAHAPLVDADTAQARARSLLAQASAERHSRAVSGVLAVGAQATRAHAALGTLPVAASTAGDVALTRAALQAVSQAAVTVGSALTSGRPLQRSVHRLVADALGTLVPAALPGVTARQLARALTVADRLADLSRDPTTKSAAALLKALRGGSTAGLSTVDYVITSALRAADGAPLDLTRYLGGALLAASKDLSAQAHALRTELP